MNGLNFKLGSLNIFTDY